MCSRTLLMVALSFTWPLLRSPTAARHFSSFSQLLAIAPPVWIIFVSATVSSIEIMTTITLPLEYYKPPPYSQLYTPQVVVVPQPLPIQYKCLYLAILIVNLIVAIILGLILVAVVVGGIVAESEVQTIHEKTNGIVSLPEIWMSQALAAFLLIVVITFQHYGWKGYNNHDVKAIAIFACNQFFGFVFCFILLCCCFTMWTLLLAGLSGSFFAIPILFANEIRKRESGLVLRPQTV